MRPILFVDFDGTLCHYRFWRTLAPALRSAIQQHLFIERRHVVREWMVGEHTSEEINRMLATELSLPYELLWETFVADCKTMRVSPTTLQLIDSLRSRYHAVLITGNMDCFDRFTKPALALHEHFDYMCNSYTDGRLKDDNDGQVFVDIARILNSDLKASYIVDDSSKVCTVFTELGGTSLLVSSDQDIDHHLRALSNKVL